MIEPEIVISCRKMKFNCIGSLVYLLYYLPSHLDYVLQYETTFFWLFHKSTYLHRETNGIYFVSKMGQK